MPHTQETKLPERSLFVLINIMDDERTSYLRCRVMRKIQVMCHFRLDGTKIFVFRQHVGTDRFEYTKGCK